MRFDGQPGSHDPALLPPRSQLSAYMVDRTPAGCRLVKDGRPIRYLTRLYGRQPSFVAEQAIAQGTVLDKFSGPIERDALVAVAHARRTTRQAVGLLCFSRSEKMSHASGSGVVTLQSWTHFDPLTSNLPFYSAVHDHQKYTRDSGETVLRANVNVRYVESKAGMFMPELVAVRDIDAGETLCIARSLIERTNPVGDQNSERVSVDQQRWIDDFTSRLSVLRHMRPSFSSLGKNVTIADWLTQVSRYVQVLRYLPLTNKTENAFHHVVCCLNKLAQAGLFQAVYYFADQLKVDLSVHIDPTAGGTEAYHQSLQNDIVRSLGQLSRVAYFVMIMRRNSSMGLAYLLKCSGADRIIDPRLTLQLGRALSPVFQYFQQATIGNAHGADTEFKCLNAALTQIIDILRGACQSERCLVLFTKTQFNMDFVKCHIQGLKHYLEHMGEARAALRSSTLKLETLLKTS